MKYGIIENNKFTFIDEDLDTLKNTLPFIGKSEEDIREFADDEVELAYDGSWYVKGYAPEKPQELINAERIAELKKLLADADYWGQKYLDGEYTEEEWLAKKATRRAWREELRMLENKPVDTVD